MAGEIDRERDASIIRKISVVYRLAVEGSTDRRTLDRVMGFHARHCGIYRSLHPQIEITTSLEIVER